MSRKVFISVLGTGNYKECIYVSEQKGFKSSSVYFVQEATLQLLNVKEWDTEDAGIILLTEGAKNKNWEGTTLVDPQTDQLVKPLALKCKLEEMNLPFSIKGLSIPNGKNETEIWTIFNQLFSELKEDDELYFDLTHGFRYLPMLVLVLGNYAKLLKKIKVVHITYGNWEDRNLDTNEAPIIDLLPLSTLQDWTIASASYLKNGSVDQLIELCNNQLAPILRKEKGTNPDAKRLKGFVNYLKILIQNRQTCRGKEIIKAGDIKNIKIISSELNDTLIEPFTPIFKQIKNSLNKYDENGSVNNGFMAAQWCLENGLYQQACTIFHENIITYLCEQIDGLNWEIEKDRNVIGKAFTILLKELPEEQWQLDEGDSESKEAEKEKIRKVMKYEKIDLFKAPYSSMAEIRNDFNHSGIRLSPLSSDIIIKNSSKRISELTAIIKEISIPTSIIKTKKILINLSNHPISNWNEEQLKASQEYGDPIDLPFPQVDPGNNEEYIDDLCTKYIHIVQHLIQTQGEKVKVTVHIMGEQTLTFALVNAFKQFDITCVASTSKRISRELENGKKEIEFCFERFREYK